MQYKELSKDKLLHEKELLQSKFDELLLKKLSLDMSRGKPNSEQLDISAAIFANIDCYTKRVYKDNFDLGNYGLFSGTTEAKELFSELLDIEIEKIIIGGNSSLHLMYDMFSHLMLFGNQDSEKPWCKLEKVKFLCPTPGYDRHFAICERLGIEMIPVSINEFGPDMDYVESLVKEDESIKGIWCVPLYSNPDGFSYSNDTVKRLANMKTKASDFRIFWDNAYAVHHIYPNKEDSIENIIDLCEKYNNPNRVYMFTSTSKISFPGSGISAICSSVDNIADIMERMKYQTIGYDKLNMLRHVIAFKNKEGVLAHMNNLAAVIRPKFEIVLKQLEIEITPLNIAKWNSPAGGYFISFYAMNGCAKRIVELCQKAGVKLTPAGATYPYRNDPNDSNIRIAPTYPSNSDLQMAMEVFVICVKLASVEKILGE